MLFSRIRIFAALIAAASTSATGAVAAQEAEAPATQEQTNTSDAVAFARSLTANATAALTAPGANGAQKLTSFQSVLAEGLALETIGKFMLGATRKSMSEAQLDRYNEIFSPYITKLYAEQFREIVGRPLKVIDAKAIGARDVIVRTQFDRTDASPILVDWRIRKLRSGDHKAIDIIVSGVSIMLVKREEFASYIAANGVDALLSRLESEAA